MADGRLGTADLAAATYTTVYTVPAGKKATFNVSILNRNATNAVVRLAITDEVSGTPTDDEFLEYGKTLQQSDVLERTGLVAAAGEQIVAYSDVIDVSVSVRGIEVASA